MMPYRDSKSLTGMKISYKSYVNKWMYDIISIPWPYDFFMYIVKENEIYI